MPTSIAVAAPIAVRTLQDLRWCQLSPFIHSAEVATWRSVLDTRAQLTASLPLSHIVSQGPHLLGSSNSRSGVIVRADLRTTRRFPCLISARVSPVVSSVLQVA